MSATGNSLEAVNLSATETSGTNNLQQPQSTENQLKNLLEDFLNGVQASPATQLATPDQRQLSQAFFTRIREIIDDKTKNLKPPHEVEWLDKLLPAVIQTSIFGGSITFSVVVSVPDDAPERENVIHDLSIAFLLFAITLFVASGTQLALCFNRDPVVRMIKYLNDDSDGKGGLGGSVSIFGEDVGNDRNYLERLGIMILFAMLWIFFRIGVLSVIVQVLPLSAFVFLAKVILVFDHRVGAITFWFMIAFIILAGVIWMAQTIGALRRDTGKYQAWIATPLPL
ncbi:hypothetical protein BGZ60DRAFT_532432 [Tricladium varicosporioides]|nr:hypothetical protein BGZ60DRAFT_532432 [Hymenoscyphus varicosporioides]